MEIGVQVKRPGTGVSQPVGPPCRWWLPVANHCNGLTAGDLRRTVRALHHRLSCALDKKRICWHVPITAVKRTVP